MKHSKAERTSETVVVMAEHMMPKPKWPISTRSIKALSTLVAIRNFNGVFESPTLFRAWESAL